MRRMLGWVLLFAVAAVGWQAGEPAAQSMAAKVVLVRHAEPAADGSKDPGLSPQGQVRALALAAALRASGVSAILTSPYNRTRETARPVEQALGLTAVAIRNGQDLDAHIAALAAAVRAHRGGAILVVGHSNTVPALIAALGGPTLGHLCANSFDRLFTLVREGGKARLTPGRYGQPSADERPDCP